MAEFKLPDLGEGLQDAEILEWHIKEGDKVEVDQLVLVVETAKAVVEIPSPINGTVEKLFAQVGETIDVSAPLFSYQSTDGQQVVKVETTPLSESSEKSVSVVGKLPESTGNATNAYETNPLEAESLALSEDLSGQQFHTQKNRRNHSRRMTSSPSIIALAKQFGLEARLAEHQYGELSEHDLMDMVEEQLSDNHQESNNPLRSDKESRNNSIIKLSGARKIMAQSMTKSHQHIPSVTLFDDADISHWPSKEDITLRVIKALIKATEAVPLMNAWFDEDALSVQLFDDVNLGVAVNSKDGLFVPVLRQAQSLEPSRIREILDKQIRQVADRSIKPQAMLGATISLSNFGTLSGRYATPIIVPPQVAIVGVGKIRMEPVVRDNELAVGRIMPLSLSFDHRAASGSDAAAFMNALIQGLSY